MRAVVTGGCGFIGSHLVDLLLANDHQVVVFDPSHERYREPLKDVEYVKTDLGDVDALAAVIRPHDVVFHLASTTVPGTSNYDPAYDVESNLVSTLALLQACVKRDIARFVFVSSGGTIYGVPSTVPVMEDQVTNPICSYGIVKLAIEKYLFMYGQLYGLPYTILRPSNAYGPRQNIIGAQGVIAVFLGRLRMGQGLVVWGDGNTVRDFVHVSDLARACVAAATPVTEEFIFNIGSGTGVSVSELLSIIERVTGKDLGVTFLPSRPFDVPYLVLDSQRALKGLNWYPRVDLEIGVRDVWEWICQLPEQHISDLSRM